MNFILHLDKFINDKEANYWVETMKLKKLSTFSHALFILSHLALLPRLENLSLTFSDTKDLASSGYQLRELIHTLLYSNKKIRNLKVKCTNLMSYFTTNDLRELMFMYPECRI